MTGWLATGTNAMYDTAPDNRRIRPLHGPLRRLARIANRTAAFWLIVWRTLWLAALSRIEPDSRPQMALADREIRLLDRLTVDASSVPPATLSAYTRKLALIGGDHPPSDRQAHILAVWRGLTRLVDIQLAAELRVSKYRRC